MAIADTVSGEIHTWSAPARPSDKPAAPFSRLHGQAEGLYNAEAATAVFTFIDNSELGTPDVANIMVFDGDGNIVLDVDGMLEKGKN